MSKERFGNRNGGKGRGRIRLFFPWLRVIVPQSGAVINNTAIVPSLRPIFDAMGSFQRKLYIYVYLFIYMCVCVCIIIQRNCGLNK